MGPPPGQTSGVRSGSRLLAAVVAALAACASAGAAPVPSNFTATVDNPWFPLKPGTVFVYTGTKDGRSSRDVVTVTHATKRIMGVPCVVVDDRLYLDGRLEERTTDWYTQDKAGNVWYFGEATAELDRQGRITSTEGTWQAGRDGAQPGIYMPAHPAVGQSGTQELYKGHAEDHFRVLDLHTSVTTPYTTSKAALLAEEWTPLEPAVRDHKLYVRNVGLVLEQRVKGPTERGALVSVRHGA